MVNSPNEPSDSHFGMIIARICIDKNSMKIDKDARLYARIINCFFSLQTKEYITRRGKRA